ncbi:MAG: acetyl-CoA carboxylase biotin carboxyl carrier protein subunit [Chloroflexi bacterium]|nr:acetyl-CoA carboxylase biotin carboxyl carrier protein subunit [Chloroflexota bacterium]MBP8059222.1 acetyl-CoA carboxylase biotin carboxyl carrier protein subunit [Chloroflexota bacterium]
MKFKVQVEGQTFTVDVGDLHTRPIIATLNEKVFAVWPEEMEVERIAAAPIVPTPSPKPAPQPSAPIQGNGHIIRAPIPGIVNRIAVSEGATVAVGQDLCVLEAMKMNNVIRATRAGKVKAIPIITGQHVRHGDALIELED